MTNYEITIGYKAVITVSVKADNEKQAKELAIKKFAARKERLSRGNITIQDDEFKADGCVDMDATWNSLYL